MISIIPEMIIDLLEANISLEGLKANLSQRTAHQIIFMDFNEDVELPEHLHESLRGVAIQANELNN